MAGEITGGKWADADTVFEVADKDTFTAITQWARSEAGARLPPFHQDIEVRVCTQMSSDFYKS